MSEEKIDIPEEIQQMCRDFAKVARKHDMYKFSGNFTPITGWGGEISFNWEAGRHGEDSNKISIYSRFSVHTKISDKLTNNTNK